MTKNTAHLINRLLLLAVIGSCLLLVGCTTPEPVSGDSLEQARTLLDRVEFDDDEYGSFEVEGTIDLNPLPFFGANVHIKLEKFKDKPIAATLTDSE
jgi:hypothetical protein